MSLWVRYDGAIWDLDRFAGVRAVPQRADLWVVVGVLPSSERLELARFRSGQLAAAFIDQAYAAARDATGRRP